MTDLPTHASREICKRERRRLYEILSTLPGGTLFHIDVARIRWLLDECDQLEQEAVSAWAESKHWQDEAKQRETTP